MASHKVAYRLLRLSSPISSFQCGMLPKQFSTINESIARKPNAHDDITVIRPYSRLNVLRDQRFAKHSSTSKYSRGKDKNPSEDDDDYGEEQSANNLGLDPSVLVDVDGKDVKVIKSKLNSMRLDSLLKAGLNTAKHKVEEAFYESRIRVNGEKILKKSRRMEVGDEIDLIKGPNAMNPEFLDISRVIVIAADYKADLERVAAVLKRYKSLTIENYPNAPYRGGHQSN